MKPLKLTFCIFLFSIYSLTAIGQARSNPKTVKTKGNYVHTSTNTTFPERLFNYQLKSVYSFNKRNTDIGVTYDKESAGQKTTISIYIYPAGEGSEGRLRNEYLLSLHAIARNTSDGMYLSQNPISHSGEKYFCNGFKAVTKILDNDLTQLTLFECGTWFFKIRITSNILDTSEFSNLEDEIIKTFDPSRLTALKPLNLTTDIFISKAAFRDSTMLGATLASASKKIDWAKENIEENERVSGFPDLYLYMHIASLMEIVKFDKEKNISKSASTQLYLDELNSIINSGYIAEFIMEQFKMVMIVPENVIFDFEGFEKWKQANPITINLEKRYYLLSYGLK